MSRWPLLIALAAALLAAGCGTGGLVKGGDATRGKTLFMGKGRCAGCHALADAGSVATVGPNLDDAFAASRSDRSDMHVSDSTIESLVLDQIRIAAPPMPANLVKGQDAADVAAYVASVAGKPPSATAVAAGGAGAAGGGGGASDGKAIFSANCSSCHTLAAAGATGTVGPNLDQLKPPEQRVVKQVTKGGAIMPAFKGKLSDAQIKAVAKFVASSAGKK
ncbi:MAG TPA: c-type cytochrome [Gaiellaceae bacterium]